MAGDHPRNAEEALRASEARLRHVVEHARDLIYYCDVNGRFTYVNPAAARVTGYAEAELIGRHFITLIRRDARAQAAMHYKRQVDARVPSTYLEFPALTKDGATPWFGQHVQLVFDGERVVALHAIARDITRQKDAEERLRKSEAHYRSLIQGAAYGIVRTAEDGTILDANAALASMLGYESVEELQARNIADIYGSPGARSALFERYRDSDRRTFSVDVEWRRKDGAAITVHLSARVVEDADGVQSLEGIAEDVTARRALEEQLRQAQKMEAVGRLARGIAHDFNNILAAILGCSDLLAMHLPAGDPAMDDATEIRRAAERGAALTRQLMAFSRSQAREPQRIDLTVVLPQHAAMLRTLAGANVDVHIQVPATAVPVMIEPGQLEQVLLNLVVNARDAMPDGGTIQITTDILALDDQSAVRYQGLRSGAYARLSVTDTGAGIAPEAQAHLFEPFFTTKDPSKGTGLGLSVVYGIARDARGAIAFTTAPGAGTTFEVLLPLAATA